MVSNNNEGKQEENSHSISAKIVKPDGLIWWRWC
jgi:hypothetical protein